MGSGKIWAEERNLYFPSYLQDQDHLQCDNNNNFIHSYIYSFFFCISEMYIQREDVVQFESGDCMKSENQRFSSRPPVIFPIEI